MSEKPVFSIVVPMYNESGSILEFYRRVTAVMNGVGDPWEFLLVDDGSKDDTGATILDLAKKDKIVRPVIFTRNFGQQSAVAAGLTYSRGDAVVVIDADLQDPPEVIPELIEKWRQGYEVVYAKRQERQGETFMKKFTARMFYRLINKITDIDIPLDTGFFRLIDRRVVDVINKMGEHHRFFRAMSIWVGFKQIGVEFLRDPRYAGKTSYSYKKMFKLAATAITGFSFWPLQVSMYLGFISAGFSVVAIPFVIFARLNGNAAFAGQATTLIAVLFFGGIQLISLGVLGEYIGRMYDDIRNRPLYIVRHGPDDEFKEKN